MKDIGRFDMYTLNWIDQLLSRLYTFSDNILENMNILWNKNQQSVKQ